MCVCKHIHSIYINMIVCVCVNDDDDVCKQCVVSFQFNPVFSITICSHPSRLKTEHDGGQP